ncbi:hypothetical protein QE152_g26533 [Popillia japonica]|uniref:Uncharacterized protein n=1 Tax=Popillia japonica TaxID=7064 RepID=A0AAW1JXM9_POPJA
MVIVWSTVAEGIPAIIFVAAVWKNLLKLFTILAVSVTSSSSSRRVMLLNCLWSIVAEGIPAIIFVAAVWKNLLKLFTILAVSVTSSSSSRRVMLLNCFRLLVFHLTTFHIADDLFAALLMILS